jgi:Flp pilus assembly protein TadD
MPTGKNRLIENFVGSKVRIMKPIGVKITAIVSSLAAGAALVSCTPAAHTDVAPRSRRFANESAAAFNAKDYAKAQTLAAEATNLDPQFAEAWVGYGMASVRLGQTNQARQAYEQALALHQARHRQNPSNADQVVQQIFLLTLLGRPTEAEALLKQARIDYPHDQTISQLADNFAATKQGLESLAVESK